MIYIIPCQNGGATLTLLGPCGRALHGVHHWVQMKKGLRRVKRSVFLDEPNMSMTFYITLCYI
jgi:hypothetical protein